MSRTVVTVYMFARNDFRARCSCGHESPRRRRQSRAKLDAHWHAAATGHFTDWPLTRLRDGRPVENPSWRMPWWPWTATFAVILGGAVYFSCPPAPARADIDLTATQFAYVNTYGNTGICAYLTAPEHHTVQGLARATQIVMTDGFTAYEAAQIVTASVGLYCPANIPLIQQLVAQSERQAAV